MKKETSKIRQATQKTFFEYVATSSEQVRVESVPLKVIKAFTTVSKKAEASNNSSVPTDNVPSSPNKN